jgi:hypothetical protein
MGRNLTVAALVTTGVALVCWTALDWVAYTGFSISLIWK